MKASFGGGIVRIKAKFITKSLRINLSHRKCFKKIGKFLVDPRIQFTMVESHIA